MGSDKHKWISDGLANFPKQPTVSYEELTKIFLDLTAINSSKILDAIKFKIVTRPVSEW